MKFPLFTLKIVLVTVIWEAHAAAENTNSEDSTFLRESKPTRFLEGLQECSESAQSILRRSRIPGVVDTVNALAERHQGPNRMEGVSEEGENEDVGVGRGRQNGSRGGARRNLFGLGQALDWAQGFYGDFFTASAHPEQNDLNSNNQTSSQRATQIYTDVIIIGAGMAGLSAAAELERVDPNLEYILLESTDRIGGRVRSHTMGARGREVVVEDGANWIIPFKNNPLWDRAQNINLQGMTNNYNDWTVYDDKGAVVDPDLVRNELNRFLVAFNKAGDDAEEQWTKNHATFNDQGVVQLLANNGWTVAGDDSGNLDYIMQWLYLDFEYAAADTSVRYFPYTAENPYLVTDQRGYQSVIDSFRSEKVNANNIKFNKRVTKIDYGQDVCLEPCLGLCLGTNYKAVVTTEDGVEYFAQRVISTVSTGVLEKEYISFSPTLKYSSASTNPYEMTQYVKIFYQFNTTFWDDTEFVEVALKPENRGKCHHWQNMELAIPGSAIIRCELMTEGFDELVDPTTGDLSPETLLALLDPLRAVYGDTTVGKPIDMYYPKLNKDKDYGNGAYGNWKIGKTFTDFAKFFGGTELTSYCDFNGCNSQKEWILQLSGSASCYDYSEFVHGAYFSGLRSSRFALESMGYSGIPRGDESGCDAYWNELV